MLPEPGKKKSLFDLLDAEKSYHGSDPMITDSDTDDESDSQGGFAIKLKKKRRSAVLRQMLEQGGYKDLSKMLSLRDKGDE